MNNTVLFNTAYRWWLSKRPCAFTAADHIANPTINCVSAEERDLARAVAMMKAKNAESS